MAYINLPISLDQIVSDMQDQIDRNTTSYSGPQVSADAAQGLANQASTQANLAFAQATVALQQANLAYAAGAQSIQISAQTIVNSSNQLTAMNTNGITVYSGASATSGARVVMNSAGIAGFNTYGVTTFAIDATNGNVSTTGAVFTQSTISGGSLNINGNAIIDSSGFLTASGATIQGTITSSSGTIGGWTINSGSLTANSGLTSLNSSSGSITTIGSITGSSLGSTGGISAGGTIGTTSGGLTIASGGATITGTVAVTGTVTMSGNLVVQSMSSLSATGVVWSSSNSRFYLTTSTERHKDNITPIPEADYLSKILSLQLVTFNYKPEFTDNPNQIISGLIAERVAEIPEFSTVINLDKDGLPESISYDRLSVFIFPALKQINDRLEKLEGK